MKRFYHIISIVLVLFALSAGVLAVSAQDQEETANTSPVGRWVSVACELRPGPQYLKRDFTFQENSWVGDITVYADPACIIPTVTLHIEGPINFGEPVEVAEGAVATDFSGESVSFTPLAEDMVGFLNSAEPETCGTEAWELNVEQDISATGCSLFGLEVPFTEHDITLVRNDFLFAGARPLDGSGLEDPDNRPTALQVPLMRAEEDIE
jgi:hypothetical protein